MSTRTVDDVTCLGCGCACDDIRVVVRDERIVDAENACPLGRTWFAVASGDARVIPRSEAEAAIDAAATLLINSVRPLVYLAPGISSETQREAAAIADLLRARLDSVTSGTARPFIIAAQERGYASATFGEIRNRADIVVFWAIDVAQRYPRFEPRYAPEPAGLHIPNGRRDRRVVAVDVGHAISTTANPDHRLALDPSDELAVLTALQALVRDPTPAGTLTDPVGHEPAWSVARELAALFLTGRYIALLFDAEPDDRAERSSQRFDALLGLSHALNQRVRCAAVALRGGGNRSGADAVLTAHTGYPFGIDFARGHPRYDVFADSAPAPDVVLIVGDISLVPKDWFSTIGGVSRIVIGPASVGATLGADSIAIDTGTAGIHETGTAFRADDIPLALRAPLSASVSAAHVVRSLAQRVSSMRRNLPPAALASR